MNLRCIIADDEPLAKMLLEKYVEQTPGLSLAASFTSALQAKDAIVRNVAPLAFLDIHMPGIDGLRLARVAADSGVRVIFTTAYPDYALDGFRLNALDYLLKPIDYEDFIEAVRRAEAAINPVPRPEPSPASEFLVVRANYRNIRIDLSAVTHVEAMRDYIKIFTFGTPRPVITRMSMKTIEQTLPGPRFVRTHRSFIVDSERIVGWSNADVLIDAGAPAPVKIPVGDKFREELLKTFPSPTVINED